MSDPLAVEVRAANAAFYRAFRDRDGAAMERLWAEHVPVACIHPGMNAVRGRDEVMRSWRGILAHPHAPALVCSDVRVHVLGTSAFVTCLEGTEADPPRLVATNVFVRESGFWRIAHHQAGPLAAGAQREASTKRPPPKDELPN
ncbi:MAG: nuclear transport factor 2 family protein [Myxococcota bacterium]